MLASGLLSGAFLSVIISAGLLATAGFSAFISLASAVVFFISCLLFTVFSLSRFGSDGFLASGLSAFSGFAEAVFSLSAALPAAFTGSSAIAFWLNLNLFTIPSRIVACDDNSSADAAHSSLVAEFVCTTEEI